METMVRVSVQNITELRNRPNYSLSCKRNYDTDIIPNCSGGGL